MFMQDVFNCNPPFNSVYSHASDVDCDGHIYILDKDIYAHRMLASVQRTQSPTYRELAAIQICFGCIESLLFSVPG